jgi:peroxiredoxin Q/BCP
MWEREVLFVGDASPDLSLPNEDRKTVPLADFRGQGLVFCFYPKDNTPRRTREVREFSQYLAASENLGAVVIGVSRDSPKSHTKCRSDHTLEVLPLSDRDHRVISAHTGWGR